MEGEIFVKKAIYAKISRRRKGGGVKKYIPFIFMAVFFFAADFIFAADVYLKNGSVIKGVHSYRKVDGKVLLEVYGGMMEISEKDVLKILESSEPYIERETKSPPPQPPTKVLPPPKPKEETFEEREAKKRLREINQTLKEIKEVEDNSEKLEKEYDEVRLRIEVLFQKGFQAAQAAGKDMSQWQTFLNPQEREWVQINFLRKEQLEKEREEMKKELDPLLEEKKSIIREKKFLEELLSPPEGP